LLAVRGISARYGRVFYIIEVPVGGLADKLGVGKVALIFVGDGMFSTMLLDRLFSSTLQIIA